MKRNEYCGACHLSFSHLSKYTTRERAATEGASIDQVNVRDIISPIARRYRKHAQLSPKESTRIDDDRGLSVARYAVAAHEATLSLRVTLLKASF